MKKRLLGISIMLLFLLGNVGAILPYKESLDIKDLRISKVQCSDNKLNVLAENKEAGNIKILFKIYSSKGNLNVFSNELLKRLEARYMLINTHLGCMDLLRLEINGYIDLGNEGKIVYLNSEPSYQFTGNEQPISAEIMQPVQDATEATQSAQQSSRNSYIYLGSKLIASFDSSNSPLYYSQDNIGSNVILTDNNGNLISGQQFEPFGDEVRLSSINSRSKFKFTGKEQDSSNLYYYGARYYDQKVGRFLSIDPIFNPSESSYAYANNNPINKVDPDGRAGQCASCPDVTRVDPSYLEHKNDEYEKEQRRLERLNTEAYLSEWHPELIEGNPMDAGMLDINLDDIASAGLLIAPKMIVKSAVKTGARKVYSVNAYKKAKDIAAGINYLEGYPKDLILRNVDGLLYLGDKPYHGKVIWVVTESGELIFGARTAVKLSHAQLAKGSKVLGAGENDLNYGLVRWTNPQTGHYMDLSSPQEFSRNSLESFWEAAEASGLKTTPGPGGRGGTAFTNIKSVLKEPRVPRSWRVNQ